MSTKLSGDASERRADGSPRRLVVGFDGSAFSERAVVVASEFAQRLGIAVEVVAVAQTLDQYAPLNARVQRLVNEVGASLAAEVVQATSVEVALAARVDDDTRTVIALAGHGRGRAAGALLHSVVAGVAASTTAPILVIGPETAAPSANLPIVACVDGSTDSDARLRLACEWATYLDVGVVAVAMAAPRRQVHGQPPDRHQSPDVDAWLTATLAANAPRFPDLTVTGHVVRYPWSRADALERYLTEHPSQLVVVPRPAGAGWFVLGDQDISLGIVRHAPIPVLIAPTPAPLRPAEPLRTTLGAPGRTEVIVPVRPGHASTERVLTVAAAVADQFAAGLTLLTVVPAKGDRARAQQHLAELASTIEPGEVRAHVVESTMPADVILSAAGAHPGSIICLMTRGPSPTLDAVLPTTAGQVIRWADGPVLAVGPNVDRAWSGCQHVVACIDGSAVSSAVVALAREWADRWDVPLVVLEVGDPDAVVAGAPSLESRFASRLLAECGRRQERDHAIVIGDHDVSGAIVEAVRNRLGALLVLGSHGAGESELRAGHVVMDVIHRASVPVLVHPAHGSDTYEGEPER